MGYANTKFKVGDKVRVLNKSGILYGHDLTCGKEYEVITTSSIGIYIKDDAGDKLSILVKEYSAIELVKEDVNMSYAESQQYRTEKRKARVGERILIKDAYSPLGTYENGAVFTVRQVGSDRVEVLEHETFLFDYEYEVIVGETQSHGERIAELESKVAALEAVLAEKSKLTHNVTINCGAPTKLDLAGIAEQMRKRFAESFVPIAKTQNQRRADVIKQAREFVAEHTEPNAIAGGGISGVRLKEGFITLPEFIVNSEKRTVVVLMKGVGSGMVRAKGIAKCAPGDVFNADIGKAIALGRAKGVVIPSEFFNAQQPTEVVVGMRVGTNDSVAWKPFKVDEIKVHYGAIELYDYDGTWVKSSEAKILEDTNAVYEAQYE